jgi:hypothetical protein
MRKLIAFFPIFVFACLLCAAGPARSQQEEFRSLASTAEGAIYNYFYPSGRRVEKIRLESYRKINTVSANYLVEADVRAQSPVTKTFIEYRCGVFLQRNRFEWEERYTDCEALADYPF